MQISNVGFFPCSMPVLLLVLILFSARIIISAEEIAHNTNTTFTKYKYKITNKETNNNNSYIEIYYDYAPILVIMKQ